MKALRTIGLVTALGLCVAAGADAQVSQGRLQITPNGGLLLADNAAALNDPAIVGIEAVYYPTQYVAFGINANFARAESDGSFFPAMQWDVGPDTTRLFHVGQDLSILTYSALLKAGFPVGRLTPYAAGGVGGWTFLLDPQSNDRPTRMSDVLFELGGGLHFGVGETVGIRLDVRDLIFTGYERDDLYPVHERFQSDVFLEPLPPEAKSTVHNIRLSVGFSYLVGG